MGQKSLLLVTSGSIFCFSTPPCNAEGCGQREFLSLKKNTSRRWWLKSGINSPVEGKVVYPFIYKVLYIHPWWCRMSSINSRTHTVNHTCWRVGKIYPSSQNDGSEKCVPPIVLTCQGWQFSAEPWLSENHLTTFSVSLTTGHFDRFFFFFGRFLEYLRIAGAVICLFSVGLWNERTGTLW